MYAYRLPDPDFKINIAGQEDASGDPGQGFLTLSMEFSMPVFNKKAIGGRNILNTKSKPLWSMTLNYNPMSHAQFSPVYNFLMEKRGSRKPFYVLLPQYKKSKNSDFAAWTELNLSGVTVAGVHTAGATTLSLTTADWLTNNYANGLPQIGDVFTISDANDSLHTQAYMVCHVDTNTLWDGTQPDGNIRVKITPPLQRNTDTSSVANFYNPLFKVRQVGDVQQYSLDNDNLYSFSLKLEEALY